LYVLTQRRLPDAPAVAAAHAAAQPDESRRRRTPSQLGVSRGGRSPRGAACPGFPTKLH